MYLACIKWSFCVLCLHLFFHSLHYQSWWWLLPLYLILEVSLENDSLNLFFYSLHFHPDSFIWMLWTDSLITIIPLCSLHGGQIWRCKKYMNVLRKSQIVHPHGLHLLQWPELVLSSDWLGGLSGLLFYVSQSSFYIKENIWIQRSHSLVRLQLIWLNHKVATNSHVTVWPFMLHNHSNHKQDFFFSNYNSHYITYCY